VDGMLGRSHPAWSPASGLLAVSGPSRSASPHLPASAARGPLTCGLCTNMWMSCAQRRCACAYRGGNAVDSAVRPDLGHGLYLGKRHLHPVHPEESGIVHMPRRNR